MDWKDKVIEQTKNEPLALVFKNNKENNKLIQAFYDGTLHPMVEKGHIRGLNGLDYHTSWDWLMPVIKKIRNTTKAMPLFDYSSVINVEIEKTYASVVKCISIYYEEINKNKED